jgi:hypothetical protein
MRFITVPPLNKLSPNGCHDEYRGFVQKRAYWRVFLSAGVTGIAKISIPSSLKDSASSKVV